MKTQEDMNRQSHAVLSCGVLICSNLILVAVSSVTFPGLAGHTSPGKRKQPTCTLMVSTLKVVTYSEVVHCWVE